MRTERSMGLLTVCVLLFAATFPAAAQDAPDDRGQMELARFVGSWEGKSADGRFREETRYRWGPGRTHLLIEMRFFLDDEATGEGTGFMAWDADENGLVFHMVSSQGTVIRQTQIGGDHGRMEMAAETVNGASTGFPRAFRTHIEFTGAERYESGVWLADESGEWQQVMENRFRRLHVE